MRVGLLLIAMCLTFTTCSIQKLTEAIYAQWHHIDFSVRSARYDYTLKHVVMKCSKSLGPTILCTEEVMKCIDAKNTERADFDYMRSYIKCEHLFPRSL